MTLGDSAGVNDPNVNPDGDWGCFWTGFHRFTVNVSAYTEPIEMGYLISDDCYQDFDGTLGVCGDIVGTISVDIPSDEPLCINDDNEPNDFLESPDTWTAIESWGYVDQNTICPGDIDIFTHRDLAYGGWVHMEIIDLESTGNMEVTIWDLGISEYALDYVTSDVEGDTIEISYQNYGGIDGSTGPADIVMSVEGTTGAAQFDYSINVQVQQPEVYSFNIHDGVTAVSYTHLTLPTN